LMLPRFFNSLHFLESGQCEKELNSWSNPSSTVESSTAQKVPFILSIKSDSNSTYVARIQLPLSRCFRGRHTSFILFGLKVKFVIIFATANN
jgi:hypothetical protein